jgi:hypothetical protein
MIDTDFFLDRLFPSIYICLILLWSAKLPGEHPGGQTSREKEGMPEAGSNVEMAYKISESGNRAAPHGSWFYEVLEIIEALVLATVAVATVRSGYQSALWSSLRSEHYGESSKLRIAAEADATLAADQRLYDALTFDG